MPTATQALQNQFRSVLPAESIRAATADDAVCGIQPQLVLEPAIEAELSAALRVANDAGLAVIPRGGGTKLSWGNAPARADVILSTSRLNKIIEHAWADLTVSVEAGCTIGALQSALARHHQRLAVDPLWPDRATIGGALSTNDSGALRLRFGPLRDLIIGVTIALPDGTLASSGGKVVKNVAGYDLPKLVTGAFGTLGVITRAVFRLHPLPHHTRTLNVTSSNLDGAQRLILAVQDSQLAHTSLQIRGATDEPPLLDIRFEGTEEGIASHEAQLRHLAGRAHVAEASEAIWKTLQDLWDASDTAALAKITSLPAEIGRTIEMVQRETLPAKVQWRLVMQAIGVGTLRLEGASENLRLCLLELRSQLEANSAALILLHRPETMAPLDTWGGFGDALPVMRALKQRFDQRNTLNPGRFL